MLTLLQTIGFFGFFFPRTFFLALGLVGAVLLGSFQACAIYIPAAPDVQGNRAKSKPLLLRGGLGRGWRRGGGWLQPAPDWEEVGCRLWRCLQRSQIPGEWPHRRSLLHGWFGQTTGGSRHSWMRPWAGLGWFHWLQLWVATHQFPSPKYIHENEASA